MMKLTCDVRKRNNVRSPTDVISCGGWIRWIYESVVQVFSVGAAMAEVKNSYLRT